MDYRVAQDKMLLFLSRTMHCPPLNYYFFSIFLMILACGFVLCYRELSPSTQLAYSKFAKLQKPMIPSKMGMLIIYSPSLVVATLCLWLTFFYPAFYGLQVVALASFGHYLKRELEVLFVHKYSGNTSLSSSLLISTCYTLFTYVTYYFTAEVPVVDYSKNQCLCGVSFFVLGEGFNFIHHRILSNLRSRGSTQYQIPQGALFKYTWCPHYLGEIMSFIGFALISQHIFIGQLQLISATYLCIRAYHTRIWYERQFHGVEKKWCLLPFVF